MMPPAPDAPLLVDHDMKDPDDESSSSSSSSSSEIITEAERIALDREIAHMHLIDAHVEFGGSVETLMQTVEAMPLRELCQFHKQLLDQFDYYTTEVADAASTVSAYALRDYAGVYIPRCRPLLHRVNIFVEQQRLTADNVRLLQVLLAARPDVDAAAAAMASAGTAVIAATAAADSSEDSVSDRKERTRLLFRDHIYMGCDVEDNLLKFEAMPLHDVIIGTDRLQLEYTNLTSERSNEMYDGLAAPVRERIHTLWIPRCRKLLHRVRMYMDLRILRNENAYLLKEVQDAAEGRAQRLVSRGAHHDKDIRQHVYNEQSIDALFDSVAQSGVQAVELFRGAVAYHLLVMILLDDSGPSPPPPNVPVNVYERQCFARIRALYRRVLALIDAQRTAAA